MRLRHKITGAVIEINGTARGELWDVLDDPSKAPKAPVMKKATRKKVQKDVDIHNDSRCDSPVEGNDTAGD